MVIRWFDYWLKGIQNGVDKDPPVRIFIMGDNKWRNEQHWPLQRGKDKILCVTSNGHANTPTGDGKLIYQRPEQTGNDQYLYDSKDPVPSIIELIRVFMPVDQRPLTDRKDILVYQTEPLKERVEVTGYPVVELYASSSAPDTDWYVRLIDVGPDGLAIDVSMGVVRARYRNGSDKPKLLKPGEVVKYTIRMRPTSNAFLPGHRIRLDITSSDFPNYDRNHNTAADQNADATLVVASQTIYHGGEQATRIILPWVPNPIEKEKPTEEERVEQGPENRTYPLHQAAADGDIVQVRMFISKGADVNAKDEKRNTPLFHAVESGNMGIVQLFVEAGADINMGSYKPLALASYSGNIKMAQFLIANGADVNAGPWTALHSAAYGGRRDIVELLIQKGADINAKDNGGKTPLHNVAASADSIKTVELLITEGADINAKDNGGKTPLHNVAASADSIKTVELLITEGADINAKDNGGKTPLYRAAEEGRDDIAALLIQKGADINAKDNRGLTTLHNAAVEEDQDLAESLLTKGAKVDERDDNYEFTALHYAARFGSKNVAEVLIDNGADIEAKDKWDYQPIHWAAYHDRADIVELLIDNCADVNAKTSLGQTPLQLAIPRRNTASIEVLRKYGAKEPEVTTSDNAVSQDAAQKDKAADPNAVEVKKPKEAGAAKGKDGGFTLAETMVSMAVLGVVAVIVGALIPSLGGVAQATEIISNNWELAGVL
ncbi:CocE/NonD family hydrolase, partial [Candidatus Omnitrophota bacterium]